LEKVTSMESVKILADHNIEGWAVLLWAILSEQGWLESCDMELVMFTDVGLSDDVSDRMLWRFAQANKMILLTANRNMESDDSLDKTIRVENTLTSLPVLTIGNVDRLQDKQYRESCVERLLEIVLYIENFLGAARIFIP